MDKMFWLGMNECVFIKHKYHFVVGFVEIGEGKRGTEYELRG